MGVFKNIKGKKSNDGAPYVIPGTYRAKIKALKVVSSTVNDKEFFCAELVVLESNNPERPVDSEMSWLVNMNGEYPEAALGNVNDFLLKSWSAFAISNGDDPPEEDDIDEALAKNSVSAENPLCGVELDLYAFNKPTRAGGAFTKCKWSVPEDVQEKAA